MESVKKEIGDLGHTGPYRPPAKLRKRSEFSSKGSGDGSKVFEANEWVPLLYPPHFFLWRKREITPLSPLKNSENSGFSGHQVILCFGMLILHSFFFLSSLFFKTSKCISKHQCSFTLSLSGKLWVWCYTKTQNGTSSGRTLKTTTWSSTVSCYRLWPWLFDQ